MDMMLAAVSTPCITSSLISD